MLKNEIVLKLLRVLFNNSRANRRIFCSHSFCFSLANMPPNLLLPFYFNFLIRFLSFQMNYRFIHLFYFARSYFCSFTHSIAFNRIFIRITKERKKHTHYKCIPIVAQNLNNLRKCQCSGAINNFRFIPTFSNSSIFPLNKIFR